MKKEDEERQNRTALRVFAWIAAGFRSAGGLLWLLDCSTHTGRGYGFRLRLGLNQHFSQLRSGRKPSAAASIDDKNRPTSSL